MFFKKDVLKNTYAGVSFLTINTIIIIIIIIIINIIIITRETQA